MIDLHMHTTVSDGSDAPEEILGLVREAGIDFFAVTDHDAVMGYRRILAVRKENDPRILSGVEFSCKDEKGKYHILGYGYDPDAEAFRSVVNHGHALRMKKTSARLRFLATEFGFVFPEKEIETLLSLSNPGKPHIGNLMVQHGYAETKEQAIREYIDQLHFRDEYVRPEEAIAGILGAGGVPVLAHPPFGSGNEVIVGEAMDLRLRRLLQFGIAGLECFYSGYTPKLQAEMLGFAEKYHLFVTAGSDYHGRNKLVKLGETGMDSVETIPEGLKRFLTVVGEDPEKVLSNGVS